MPPAISCCRMDSVSIAWVWIVAGCRRVNFCRGLMEVRDSAWVWMLRRVEVQAGPLAKADVSQRAVNNALRGMGGLAHVRQQAGAVLLAQAVVNFAFLSGRVVLVL